MWIIWHIYGWKVKSGENDDYWILKDKKAQRFIISTIDKDPLMYVIKYNIYKEMFDKLSNVY